VAVSDRGIATALDAMLCLLLVSAAVVTLVTVPAALPVSAPPTDAHGVAGLLAAGTVTVTYGNETANGTYANLLADAAAVRAREPGNRSPAFVAAVRRAVDRIRRDVAAETQILAVWRPAPDRPVGARVRIGPASPPGTDVEASSFVVPLRGRAQVRVVVRTWSP
jgi:hypothetical protein